jgi:hypothetical protein
VRCREDDAVEVVREGRVAVLSMTMGADLLAGVGCFCIGGGIA